MMEYSSVDTSVCSAAVANIAECLQERQAEAAAAAAAVAATDV
jgi:hypothetical protein